MACQNKHYGLISYDIAIYTQCMTTVLNCLQLWKDFGSWGGALMMMMMLIIVQLTTGYNA